MFDIAVVASPHRMRVNDVLIGWRNIVDPDMYSSMTILSRIDLS